MSRNTTKDREALLVAFASMLNDFYGSDADGTTGNPPPAPTAPPQGGLEFDSTPAKHITSPAFSEGPWKKIEVHREMGVTLKVQPELYKKMIWLTENVPQMSHQGEAIIMARLDQFDTSNAFDATRSGKKQVLQLRCVRH